MSKVTVELIVTVDSGNKWNDDCTIGQMKKQAREAAVTIAKRALEKDPLVQRIETGEVIFTGAI